MHRMLRFITYIFIAGLLTFTWKRATTNSTGAPVVNSNDSGYSGGPRENGRTCATAGCHNGPATASDGMISVQGLDTAGYEPGKTYQVQISTNQGTSRWGFQASVQTPSGDLAGTLQSTSNATQNPLVPGYITHTFSGNAQNTWTFDWTAPAAGTGEVGIYVAVNASNANGTNQGDDILTDELTIPENLLTTIPHRPSAWTLRAIVPGKGDLTFLFEGAMANPASVALYDLQGRLLTSSQVAIHPGQQQMDLPYNLPQGMYLLHIEGPEGKRAVEKFWWP